MENFNKFQYSYIITFYILLFAVIIVTRWKIFVKAGIDGWKAIIPFYSSFTLVTKVARKSQVYFWIPLLSFFGIIFLLFFFIVILFASFSYRTPSYAAISTISTFIMLFLMIGLIVLLLVMSIILNISIARNFGEDTGFGVGLSLLYIPFYLILAYGKYKFHPITKNEYNKIKGKIKDEKYEEIIYLEDGEEIIEEDGYEYIYEDEEEGNKK